MSSPATIALGALASLLVASCDPGSEEPCSHRCGPCSATVERVVDGDTVELEGGQRVRYLMVDTPESTGGKDDCYGQEAKTYNEQLVLGQTVTLEYDEQCEDMYGRLLAYVSVQGQEVNTLLVERGYACVLHIPPNGEARKDEFESLEVQARAAERGMWNPDTCAEVTCD